MKYSLCGMSAAKEDTCVLCAKAFAAGQAAERERCALLAEECDELLGEHSELAARIRDRS